MKAMTMDDIIVKVIEILRSHQMDAYNNANRAWVAGQLTREQHDMVVRGMDGLFDDAVEQVRLCETPAEIEQVMHKFETIAQAWVKRTGIPCDF